MKSHSRRSFLRGIGGASLSLPFLESLNAASVTPATRLAIFYVPIGVVRRGFFPGEGHTAIPKFSSNQEAIKGREEIAIGRHDLPTTPTLEPLQAVKEHVTLLTGMGRAYQEGTDVHAQCGSCFLSSATPYSVKESPYPLDRTLDQVIADQVGRETPFRTLEFSCNSHQDNKESIFFDNISWYGTDHVAPSMRDPRKAYQRLFGTQEVEAYQNITDLVLEDAKVLEKQLGARDREKFGEYYDSIRTIELQMERLEKMRSELATVSVEEPAAARLPRGEYIRLMGDLMVVALQTGLTRIATFMVGPERWDTPFTFDGLFDKPMSHHKMSHNQDKFIEQLQEVDRFHMEQYVYLIDKMASIREKDGSTLLDNTIFTYGSGLGDGATHQYSDLPIIVAGRGGGAIQPQGHHHLSDGTPLANLWMTQAQAMGAKLERFADSSGVVTPIMRT